MSKVPKLRFPEFEREWEEKELGEISESESSSLSLNKLNLVEEGYAVYGADGEVGLINDYDQKNKYIAIIKDGSGVGKTFLYKGKTSVLATLSYLKSRNKIVLEWLYYLLQTIDLKSYVKGTGIPHIYFSDYSRQLIYKPQEEEQQKIADCLSSLDELIEARREKIASLKAYKKGLLQQLFPQEVCNNYPSHPLIFSKLPKLRFVGFEEEWEEVRLGEIGVFLSSLAGKTKEDFDKGNAKYIPYMNVYKNTFIDIHSLGKVNIREEEKQNVVKKGDILFTISSETPEEAGMSSVLADEIKDCYVNSFCSLFRFNSLSDKNIYFYGYLLRHRTIREYFRKTAQGSTRFNLSKESFKNLSLLVSKLGEQQKIADCLLSLDEKIAVETEQVVQLQQHKKGLLQQLLV